MSGVQITAALDGAAGAAESLAKLDAAGRSLRPALEEIGAALLLSTQQRFERQAGPDGAAWRPLAAATLERRAGKRARRKDGSLTAAARRRISGAQILRDSGRLYQSLTYRAGEREVKVGSNVVYAAIHQLGGNAGRGRKVRLPARPYLGLDDGDRREIEAILAEHVARVIGS